MKRLFLVPLLLPVVALAQPLADEIGYHYLEVGYLFTERDVPGDTLDGRGPGGLEYSFDIRPNLHLFGGFEAVNFKDVGGKRRTRAAGIGTHFHLARRLSVFGRIGYTDLRLVGLDANGNGNGNRDDGVVGTAGVRLMPATGYEIRASASHRELDRAGGESWFSVGGDIYLTNVAALTLDFTLGEDENALLVGGRFYFGRDMRTRRRW